MKHRICLVVLALLMSSTILYKGYAADETLRNTLENTWKACLLASKSGKESEFEKTMSSFRFATTKNDLANARRCVTPEVVKSFAEEVAPDISSAKFVTLIEKGPTAGLVYVKNTEEKDATGKPHVVFSFIKLVKEETGWKVDGAVDIDKPKYQADGKETAFEASDLPPTFQIDGQVLKPPKLLPIPDVAGFLDVVSYGYKTQVTINDVEQQTTVDESYSGLITGGIRKGTNSMVVVFTQTKKMLTSPKVKIRRVLANHKTEESFKYEPKENIEGKHVLTFTINE